MWKLKDAQIRLIIALLCSTTIIAVSIKAQIPDGIRTKLSRGMIEALESTPIWVTIDSLVKCTSDAGPDYVEQVESEVGDLIITNRHDTFKIFRAQLYPLQVIEIAKVAIVASIDINDVIRGSI